MMDRMAPECRMKKVMCYDKQEVKGKLDTGDEGYNE